MIKSILADVISSFIAANMWKDLVKEYPFIILKHINKTLLWVRKMILSNIVTPLLGRTIEQGT